MISRASKTWGQTGGRYLASFDTLSAASMTLRTCKGPHSSTFTAMYVHVNAIRNGSIDVRGSLRDRR